MSVEDDEEAVLADGDSEDEANWEEVAVPRAVVDAYYAPEPAVEAGLGSAHPTGSIEITIQSRAKDEPAKKKGVSHAERLVRIDCHKIHTVTLLANAWIRNRWLNDELLHARLMSLTPMSLQNSFAMIHKSRVPDANKRGRLFEAAITRLVEWWADYFEVLPEGHLRSRTFDEVTVELRAADERQREKEDAERRRAKGKGKATRKGKERARDPSEAEDEEDGEIVRSAKSLMKHALMRCGSRDVSAQLFTALCRALGIPARLVVSLQSVPWQAGVGRPKPPAKKRAKGKGKEKTGDTTAGANENADVRVADISITPVDVKGKGKARDIAFPGSGLRVDGNSAPVESPSDPVIKLRKTKSKGYTLGAPSPPPAQPAPLRPVDPLTTPPVFWTEVFSRPDGRWIPVDPIRCIVNKRKAFDPAPPPGSAPAPRTRTENRLVYVLALEEDGYGRDVTPRYAREFGAKVAKVQGAERAGSGGRSRKAWWDGVVEIVRRPYRLQRDDVEDDELQVNQLTEAMPTTMTGFKDHPLYALARHLRRDEVIHPLTELGKFRGEPVYPRGSVIPLKTAENWMRSGRKVKSGCQPMKWVKTRAVTVHKRRAVEMALAEQRERAERGEMPGDRVDGVGSEDGPMQGLYALGQTELYLPDPVINGKVPKNDFGNIDLYVPSMLPAGAVHIPFKGTAKIARQLGLDYAEAVTGFEFKRRQATPVLTGIVIAAENEELFLEAYWEAERNAAEKERMKRKERVIKRWIRLVHGMRIRQRLQAQYADRAPQGPMAAGEEAAPPPQDDVPQAGGFLTGADDVVQAYSLPRYQHLPTQPLAGPSTHTTHAPKSPAQSDDGGSTRATTEFVRPFGGQPLLLQVEGEDEDEDMDDVFPAVALAAGAPKTMQELAEDAANRVRANKEQERDILPVVPAPGTPATNGNSSRATRASARAVKDTGASTPATVAASSSKPRPTPRAARSSGRKRARKPSSGSESDPGDSEEPQASPLRLRDQAGASTPVVAAPTRVLRARRGKSEAQLQEEQEQEAAFRRAVEE